MKSRNYQTIIFICLGVLIYGFALWVLKDDFNPFLAGSLLGFGIGFVAKDY